MGQHRAVWRRVAIVVAGAGAIAVTTVATAPGVQAKPSPGYSHSCGLPLGNPDDGVVTDLVHHAVEPLFTGSGRDAVHTLNCNVVLTVDSLLLGYEPFPGD